MKKILLMVLLLLSLHQIKAQHNIFVKAGANLSNIVHQPDTDIAGSYKTGFQLGIGERYQVSDHFNLSIELLYMNKGASSAYSKLHLNYINLPILLGYNIGKFNFELGPELGYLLFAKVKSDGGNREVTHGYSSFDTSLLAGISFFVTDKINLNWRYAYGISSIGSIFYTTNSMTAAEVEEYNRSIQLSLNYKLNN